ncbi:MAG TPA: guanylate kinase [Stellaceae bacterium]|nr:guanylate kinase [Stellaceae bacterium]
MGEIKRRGILLVLSSPSGAGKTTITRALVDADPELAPSISVTTRPRRAEEVDGRHYHFITRARFDAMVAAGELLEHAVVFDHCYGTPLAAVAAALATGSDIVSDVDWQGTQQLKERLREDLVSVFILPPSLAALEQRLRQRAQDSAEVVAARMAKSADEMSHWPEYDYVIVNRELDDSVRQVRSILVAERARRDRQVGLSEFVNRLRAGA